MMKEPVIDEGVARKFLLGELSPEEQGQIEELAFEHPDAFTFLESVEDDLIDEFLQDELSPLEKQHFQDHFLSFQGRREDKEIGRVLQKYFNPAAAKERTTPEPKEKDVVPDNDDRNFFFLGGFLEWIKLQSFWSRTITAAVLVALLLFVVWLLRSRETRTDPVQAGPGAPVSVPSPEPQVSPPLQPSPSPSPVQAWNKRKSRTPEAQKPVSYYALLIPSAAPRSSGPEPLVLPPDVSSVRLGLALRDRRNFKTYEATLENEAGTELHRWPNLKAQRLAATKPLPSSKGLVIDVRTSLLKPDEFYHIVVTGVTSKGERSILLGYHFEAKNKP